MSSINHKSKLAKLKARLDEPAKEHQRLLKIKIADIERLYGITQSKYPLLYQKIFNSTPFPGTPAYPEWVAGFHESDSASTETEPETSTSRPPLMIHHKPPTMEGFAKTLAQLDQEQERRLLRKHFAEKPTWNYKVQPSTEKVIDAAMAIMDQAMALDRLVKCQTCEICDSLLSITESDEENC